MSYIVDTTTVGKIFDRLIGILPKQALGFGPDKLEQKPLEDLLNDLRSDLYETVKKVAYNGTTYPDFPAVTENTVTEMRKFLTDDGHLVETLNDELEKCPLALLLYSILWKNGDRNKFGPIMHGLDNRKLDKEKHKEDFEKLANVRTNGSYVFYQFGKHIRDRREPIVDQHTIRAHELLRILNPDGPERISPDLVEKHRDKLKSLTKINQTQYCDYLSWVDMAIPNSGDEPRPVALLSLLDKVMFTLGKSISATKKN